MDSQGIIVRCTDEGEEEEEEEHSEIQPWAGDTAVPGQRFAGEVVHN